MKVKLEAKPNLDYSDPETWQRIVKVPARFVEVASIKEASDLCKRFIIANELGGGNWTGGDVLDDDVLVAYISYNGRAWKSRDWKAGEIILQEELCQR